MTNDVTVVAQLKLFGNEQVRRINYFKRGKNGLPFEFGSLTTSDLTLLVFS